VTADYIKADFAMLQARNAAEGDSEVSAKEPSDV